MERKKYIKIKIQKELKTCCRCCTCQTISYTLFQVNKSYHCNDKICMPGIKSNYTDYINCKAIAGDWFAVASRVAEACCNICWRIYALDSFEISASRKVEREEMIP